MRRLFSTLLTGALALFLACEAQAAASADLVRVFVYGDSLYAYVDITGAEAPITKADAEIAGRVCPASGPLETVRQAGFPVTWLLLVDNSNSMPPFREDAVAFAGSLAAACGEESRFLLASFGDAFTLLEEDVPADQLAQAMEEIPMDETVTRLHSSISAALDYFDALPRTGNELRGVVVLSDAVQYDPGAAVSYEELLERINASDVMLHCVGFGSDTAALESMGALAEASGGLHQVVGADLAASEAGAALAEAAGNLYVTHFSLQGVTLGETEEVSVTFASGGELACRASARFRAPEAADGGETDAPEEDDGQEPPPQTTVPPADSANTGGERAPASEGASEGEGNTLSAVLPYAAVCAVVLAAIAAAVFLPRRKSKAAPPAAAASEAPGIFLRLEVLQGTCASGTEFTLSGELLIGRDSACGICIPDASVSRRNSRLFLANDAVYIEDLGSQNGTRVNGAPIEMASRLRSGDEIAVGDALFRLKF